MYFSIWASNSGRASWHALTGWQVSITHLTGNFAACWLFIQLSVLIKELLECLHCAGWPLGHLSIPTPFCTPSERSWSAAICLYKSLSLKLIFLLLNQSMFSALKTPVTMPMYLCSDSQSKKWTFFPCAAKITLRYHHLPWERGWNCAGTVASKNWLWICSSQSSHFSPEAYNFTNTRIKRMYKLLTLWDVALTIRCHLLWTADNRSNSPDWKYSFVSLRHYLRHSSATLCGCVCPFVSILRK